MINFLTGSVDKLSSNLKKSFNNLPEDKNEKSKGFYFRLRRFSKFIYKDDKFFFEDDTNFFQSKKLNRFAGGKVRKFLPLNKNILEELKKLIENNFLVMFPKNKKISIGIHQIRIRCGTEFVGYPVPEGWHSDGFDFVVLLNVDSKNITGGITRIKFQKSLYDVYSVFLKSKEFIFLNDNLYNHYTDPINVYEKSKLGFRDTIVFTFKFQK